MNQAPDEERYVDPLEKPTQDPPADVETMDKVKVILIGRPLGGGSLNRWVENWEDRLTRIAYDRSSLLHAITMARNPENEEKAIEALEKELYGLEDKKTE